MIPWILGGVLVLLFLRPRRAPNAQQDSVIPDPMGFSSDAQSRLPYGSHAALARDVTQEGYGRVQGPTALGALGGGIGGGVSADGFGDAGVPLGRSGGPT